MSICLYTFISVNSGEHFNNLMNLEEIYIFLYQKAGVRVEPFLQLVDTFLTVKKLPFRFK